jgi:hypothetical protein
MSALTDAHNVANVKTAR